MLERTLITLYLTILVCACSERLEIKDKSWIIHDRCTVIQEKMKRDDFSIENRSFTIREPG